MTDTVPRSGRWPTKPCVKLAIGLIAFVLLATVPLACGLASEPAPKPETPLEDLRDLEQLQTTFNRDTGSTRLILLLSPT